MINLEIPGKKPIQADYLIMDYNGTLAVDGILINGVAERLLKLAVDIDIHILTADTFGKAAENLKNLPCKYIVINQNRQQQQKYEYISKLGFNNIIAIGNGLNDAKMLKYAALGIAVIQTEGASAVTLANADIVCLHINDALDLLVNKLRITATLRM